MTRNLGKTALISILLTGMSTSCKPTESSDLKTLDNFAAGTRNLNECVGDPKTRNGKGLGVILSALDKKTTWYTKKDKSKMKKAIHDGFSAIPPDFQNAFMELGGQIIVSSESNLLCTASERLAAVKDDKKFSLKELKALGEGLDEVIACYQFMPPSLYKKQTGKQGQLISIVLPDDVTEIKHSFVRSFGYLVAQLYSRLKVLENSSDVYWTSNENSEFRSLKRKIANGFLKDVSKTKNAKRFSQYLANGKASAVDKRSFADFVYAEAFDSYYCNAYASGSKNTRNVMKSKFKNAYNAFIGLKSAGFGLTDNDSSSSSGVNDPGVLGAAGHAVTVGRTRSFLNIQQPTAEKLHQLNWYAFADVPGVKRKKASSGFNLGWVPQWMKDIGTATRETVQGAGILYGEYSDRTAKATQAAFDRAGPNPGILGSTGAVLRGVGDGVGYSNEGGVYDQVQGRTDNIYRQVQEGRGTDKPLGLLDTASVVANATVDQAANIPGVVGDVASISRNSVSAGTGATFDAQGNLQELNTNERLAAGGSALIGFADVSGATGAVTDKVLSSGGPIKRLATSEADHLTDAGQTVVRNTGQAIQQANIVNTQLQRGLANSETFQTLNTAADWAGVKPPTSIPGAIKKTGNAAMGALANEPVSSPAPAPAPGPAPAPSSTPSIGPAPAPQ